MKYLDGNEVRLHDLIWWNEGQCVGYVSEILETEKDWGKFGGEINEAGIFLSLDMSGQVFNSVVFKSYESFEAEGVGLLTEEETGDIKRLFPMVCQFDPEIAEWTYSIKRHFHRVSDTVGAY